MTFTKNCRPVLLAGGGLLVAAVLAWSVWSGPRGRRTPTRPPAVAAVSGGGVVSPPPPLVREAALLEGLENLQRRLAAGLGPGDARTALAVMAQALHTASPAAAVAALRALLDRGSDAPTGLAFRVGPGGDLAGAPTLRVWLLDQLSHINPADAASYAERIYARHDSADEWAIALRNDWREAASTGRIAPVRARALELLDDPVWAKQPSVGFLEALDLSVATMAWEAVPRLEQWLDPAQPKALRAGAWVALDRLTMEMPADFLPALAQNRDWLASQPLLRAGLMARADLSAVRERQAVEAYLQRADITALEGKRFFELLPNVSATVSYNLVTTVRIPTLQQAARLDRAALDQVDVWQAQPQFARWRIELTVAEMRLGESVASAVRGGILPP